MNNSNEVNYAAVAVAYAGAVAAGDIVAGLYTRQACQRFLNDLEKQNTEGFPYVFDEAKANRACRFMALMPHTKGKWAAQAMLFNLEPWQCFIECNLFGWVHHKTGLRRFFESYEEIARKNGKSMRVAARGLYMLTADGEAGAEVYSGATTEKQAHEVFKPAWLMADKRKDLCDHFGLTPTGSARNPTGIHRDEDASKFETMIGKPHDGASPHCALIDEYHEHDSDHMYSTMVTGMGAREQPLLSIITTAGSSIGGPCYQKRAELVEVLAGHTVNEKLFGVIYTLDAEDEWTDPANFIKANPNLDVSVSREFLETQLDQARRSASKQNAFRTKHLNQWVGAATAWMNLIAWQKQKRAFTFEDMKGCPCWITADLASKRDIAAVAYLFLKDDNFYFIPEFFVPQDAVDNNSQYRAWVTEGAMIATPGTMTDYAFIEERILEMWREHEGVDAAFDDWQANYLITRLANSQVKVVNYNQTVKNMSEPMKQTEAMVLDGSFFHNGNPVMDWMIGCVTARVDAKENIYPRKSDPEKAKIDGPVALIMAMGRAMVYGRTRKPDYQLVVV